MKGIGNYRSVAPVRRPTSTDRRLGQIVLVGPRMSVRFMDGTTYTMPAEPFKKLRLGQGDRFMLVTTYEGKSVTDVRVEAVAATRGTPATVPGTRPKIMLRDGLKLTTRR